MAIGLSPLRYPGGKSRAVSYIYNLIKPNTETLCSPFFGGGSIELFCANNGIKVFGYDAFVPLVEFWQCLMSNSKKLANIIDGYYPLSKDEFYRLQKDQGKYKSKYDRAALFFILNRASFSGSTMSGGMSPGHPRFTKSSIERIRNFGVNNFSVHIEGFESSILNHPDDFLYLDPPYMIKNCLYGNKGDTHRNFNHAALCEILKTREKWIMSYNNCEEITKMYDGYRFLYPEWKYGMSNNKSSKEIIIVSSDVKIGEICGNTKK